MTTEVIIFTATGAFLISGLIVVGLFLKSFRRDQYKMQASLSGLIKENQSQKKALLQQAKTIEAMQNEFGLRERSLNQPNDVSTAIELAQMGATVDQLVQALNISQEEAAMIVNNYSLSASGVKKYNQAYIA